MTNDSATHKFQKLTNAQRKFNLTNIKKFKQEILLKTEASTLRKNDVSDTNKISCISQFRRESTQNRRSTSCTYWWFTIFVVFLSFFVAR